jgi:hypothetical protein
VEEFEVAIGGADHADMIDRDEVTFDVVSLRAMKRERELACSRALRAGTNTNNGSEIFALGRDIIFTGDFISIGEEAWNISVNHFILGDKSAVVSVIDSFSRSDDASKYVLSNEIGDGRELVGAPTLVRLANGFHLKCPIAPSFPRVDVQKLGSDMALHPDTNDLYLDANGNIARVSGVDYLPQKIQTLLSMQRGESPFHPSFGVRFFEYLEGYKDSPWLVRLLKLDVIRQAAIPHRDAINDRLDTPLLCVTRVRSLELNAEAPVNQRLSMRVDLDVQGLGQWQRDIKVFITTREQMEKQMAIRADWAPLLRGPQ